MKKYLILTIASSFLALFSSSNGFAKQVSRDCSTVWITITNNKTNKSSLLDVLNYVASENLNITLQHAFNGDQDQTDYNKVQLFIDLNQMLQFGFSPELIKSQKVPRLEALVDKIESQKLQGVRAACRMLPK